MFDTIQFNLKYKDVNQLNVLKTITQDHSFEETRTCNGVVFTTRLENLTVRSTETTLSIGNGSLCKFLYGNNMVLTLPGMTRFMQSKNYRICYTSH